MTDKTQSAFARRYANRDLVTLRTTSETQDTNLKTQVTELFNLYSNLESYAKITNNGLIVTNSEVQNISSTLTINQMTLLGRWASSGTGLPQSITIGSGLKLSNTGILSTNSAVVVDTSTTISAGLGLLGGGDLTQNRSFSVNFAANGEVSSVKAVRADDSRLSGLAPSTGLFDIDGGDSTVYTGTPILDGGVA